MRSEYEEGQATTSLRRGGEKRKKQLGGKAVSISVYLQGESPVRWSALDLEDDEKAIRRLAQLNDIRNKAAPVTTKNDGGGGGTVFKKE